MKITHCKLNHLKNPLGYQLTHTTFSWHTELAAGSWQLPDAGTYCRIPGWEI